jgi:5'-nucleotidase
VIVAPDTEYSGAGAAIGALSVIQPEVKRVVLDAPGLEGVEAWTVSGPPALCVYFAKLGAFGALPDLVVSGINPGANVGRSIYHSGTVGACLTARTGGIPSVAVSQEVSATAEVEGQGFEEALGDQLWDSAATVTAHIVGGLLAQPPTGDVTVLNINVPNLPLDEIKGWRFCEVGSTPPRALASVALEEKPGKEGSYRVVMSYGARNVLPPEVDGGAVDDGYVALSWLSRIEHEDVGATGLDAALDALLTR